MGKGLATRLGEPGSEAGADGRSPTFEVVARGSFALQLALMSDGGDARGSTASLLTDRDPAPLSLKCSSDFLFLLSGQALNPKLKHCAMFSRCRRFSIST